MPSSAKVLPTHLQHWDTALEASERHTRTRPRWSITGLLSSFTGGAGEASRTLHESYLPDGSREWLFVFVLHVTTYLKGLMSVIVVLPFFWLIAAEPRFEPTTAYITQLFNDTDLSRFHGHFTDTGYFSRRLVDVHLTTALLSNVLMWLPQAILVYAGNWPLKKLTGMVTIVVWTVHIFAALQAASFKMLRDGYDPNKYGSKLNGFELNVRAGP